MGPAHGEGHCLGYLLSNWVSSADIAKVVLLWNSSHLIKISSADIGDHFLRFRSYWKRWSKSPYQVTDTGSGEGQGDQQPGRDFVFPVDTFATCLQLPLSLWKGRRIWSSPELPRQPPKGPGEIDSTNFPEKEFKIKVITMLMELQRNMQELKDQVRRENTEIKWSLEGLKSRLEEVQEAINEIEIRE